MCLVYIFTFYFYFLFLFFKNCFHFQKIRILKICLVWLFVFSFHEIKILKIYDIMTSYLFVFLDLFKITLIVTTISFYPKWSLYSQLKTLKTKIYYFYFLIVSCFYFHWKCFQKSNQTHFHHRFLFTMKMKTENNQTKHSLIFPVHLQNKRIFSHINKHGAIINELKKKKSYLCTQYGLPSFQIIMNIVINTLWILLINTEYNARWRKQRRKKRTELFMHAHCCAHVRLIKKFEML